MRSAATAPEEPAYHVAARYEVGGSETGYDHLRVDASNRRLFVAHGTRIDVLDADTGARMGQPGQTPAPTAAVPEPRAPLIPGSFAVIMVAP